ncbi:glycosyl transferase [Enemella evansiae]|nr:glycosyl transferase [Enemella evansiae]OYO12577.1 glycosyl transferase [Enemella evansiae]
MVRTGPALLLAMVNPLLCSPGFCSGQRYTPGVSVPSGRVGEPRADGSCARVAPMPSPDRSLTVVVTAHRLGAMVEDCVRSLRTSVDDRIRFLLVDDGSGDDTPERLAAAARRTPNTELLALPRNVGVAAARMTALERLETDWVTFLDGDDWVARNYFPRLFDEVLAAGVDWVRVDHVASRGKQRILTRIPDINRAGRIGVPRESILSARTSSVDFAHSWSGVYHRGLVDDGTLYFPTELRTAEDRPTIWSLHLRVPEFTVARTVGLHYRLGLSTSLTQTGDDRQLDITESMRQVQQLVLADRDAEKFLPKVWKTWAGLFAWHWEHRARLTPRLRLRFAREAGALLDTADQPELQRVVRAMPESKRQAIEGLRRTASLVGGRG